MSWIRHRVSGKAPSADWSAPVTSATSGLLERLYEWERRCRGYALYPSPVLLEPSFVSLAEFIDPRHAERDGSGIPARPAGPSLPFSFISLAPPVEQKVSVPSVLGLLRALQTLRSPLAFEIIGNEREIVFQLATARSERAEVAAMLGMHFPFLNGVPGKASNASSSEMEESEDAVRSSLEPLRHQALDCRVVDFGLLHFAFQPLQLFSAFAPDPLAGVVAALGQLRPGEVAGVQVLFTPARAPWASSLEQLAGVLDGGEGERGGRGWREESLFAAQAQRKLATPLFACALRVFALSAGENSRDEKSQGTNGSDINGSLVSTPVSTENSPLHKASSHGASGDARAFALCQKIGGALSVCDDPAANGLLALDSDPLDDGGYAEEERFRDILRRQPRRSGLLLSAHELAGLVHPPVETLLHSRLRRLDPKERPLPAHLRADSGEAGALLGMHTYRGAREGVLWPDALRTRHAYMLGATRMGKSTLLLNLIAQDMASGRGLCLIDPHGDLARDVLRLVPPDREADVLYLDLADTAYPPALGLLQAEDEWEKRLLVSDLLAILHRVFSSSWGDRLEHILRHALLTLLADQTPEGVRGSASEDAPSAGSTGRSVGTSSSSSAVHTLRDIRPLLSNAAYREQVVARLDDPGLRSFWHSEFAGYSASSFSPVYNKLGLLLSSPLVRNAVAGTESRLDPDALMQGKKILIVNLAQGLIGEDNAHFLGALLVSKLQLAAMHALRRGREARVPFTLYVDEFQNFVVSSFEKILSEAGKAGLSLVLANQFLEQLGEGLQTAILSNVGALVSFRVSAHSGQRLQGEFGGFFGARELADLERGQAAVRLGKAGDSFALQTFGPPETAGVRKEKDEANAAIARIVARTRDELCRPRADVEDELRHADDALEELTRAYEEKKRAERARPEGAKPENRKSVRSKNGGAKPSTAPAADAPDGDTDEEGNGVDDGSEDEIREPETSDGTGENRSARGRGWTARVKARAQTKTGVRAKVGAKAKSGTKARKAAPKSKSKRGAATSSPANEPREETVGIKVADTKAGRSAESEVVHADSAANLAAEKSDIVPPPSPPLEQAREAMGPQSEARKSEEEFAPHLPKPGAVPIQEPDEEYQQVPSAPLFFGLPDDE